MDNDTITIIGSGLVSKVIEGSTVTPIDDEEAARQALTRRGYKLIGKYRKRGQSREVWEKDPRALRTISE